MTSLLGKHARPLVRLRKHPQIASNMFMNHLLGDLFPVMILQMANLTHFILIPVSANL